MRVGYSRTESVSVLYQYLSARDDGKCSSGMNTGKVQTVRHLKVSLIFPFKKYRYRALAADRE